MSHASQRHRLAAARGDHGSRRRRRPRARRVRLAGVSWIVRDRLRTLDRDAAERFDGLAPTPMEGPFPSVVDYCKHNLAIVEDADSRHQFQAECDEGYKILKSRPTLPVGIASLEVDKVPEVKGPVIAVQVGGKWFAREIEIYQPPGKCLLEDIQIDAIDARPGGRVQVSYTFGGVCSHHDFDWDFSEHGFVVIGVGASRTPSATPPFRTRMLEHDTTLDHKPTVQLDVAVTASWAADGSVTVSGTQLKGLGGSLDPAQDLLGHHALAFP